MLKVNSQRFFKMSAHKPPSNTIPGEGMYDSLERITPAASPFTLPQAVQRARHQNVLPQRTNVYCLEMYGLNGKVPFPLLYKGKMYKKNLSRLTEGFWKECSIKDTVCQALKLILKKTCAFLTTPSAPSRGASMSDKKQQKRTFRFFCARQKSATMLRNTCFSMARLVSEKQHSHMSLLMKSAGVSKRLRGRQFKK